MTPPQVLSWEQLAELTRLLASRYGRLLPPADGCDGVSESGRAAGAAGDNPYCGDGGNVNMADDNGPPPTSAGGAAVLTITKKDGVPTTA